MGDAMLNIGEAIVFTTLGERLKIRQYRVLEEAMDATSEVPPTIEEVEVASIWGTRSGVRVGTLESANGPEDDEKVLFKEGSPAKLKRERESLRRWSKVAPGVAPRVVEYQQQGRGAALLLQYLDGATLQDIILNGEPQIFERALTRVQETVSQIWSRTRKDCPVNAAFLGQLQSRLEDVFRLHPYLEAPEVQIGTLRVKPFAALLAEAAAMDGMIPAPFSVFIHGDFNLDNVIYNPDADRVHVVDVHRSRELDYVQDVSVHLVSSFRLPVFSPKVRRRLETASASFLRFARGYAEAQGDTTFDARLALGLVRSFATSTRFEFNRPFATAMFNRAVFLLCKLLAYRGRPWEEYRLPDSILLY
jgi:aminoglycoside phosphotransferase